MVLETEAQNRGGSAHTEMDRDRHAGESLRRQSEKLLLYTDLGNVVCWEFAVLKNNLAS